MKLKEEGSPAEDIAKGEQNNPHVLLDGKEVSLPANIKTLQDLLVWVQSEVIPSTNVLTDIILDGKYLTPEQEQESHRFPLSNYILVELRSQKTLEIVKSALSEAKELLPALYNELNESADALYRGEIAIGLELLHNAMNSIEWYLNLTTSIEASVAESRPWLKLRGIETSELSQDAENYLTFSDAEQLRKKFTLIEKAHREEDFVLLTDIIKKELIPLVEIWSEELPEIIEKIKAELHEA